MKTFAIIALAGFLAIGCAEKKENTTTAETVETEVDTQMETQKDVAMIDQDGYAQYGASITAADALPARKINERYKNLALGDTATVKFEAPINSVCQSMGCWMRLGVDTDEEVFVKFKDYAYFVPLDTKGTAVVEGKAYIEEVSVDELRHMAEDAGKSEAEIAAITETKKEYRFMADGVLIKTEQ
tara:strand:+ start:140 stop:694 length:555 start_codon:yes stop_codon:yes gene_type:complete